MISISVASVATAVSVAKLPVVSSVCRISVSEDSVSEGSVSETSAPTSSLPRGRAAEDIAGCSRPRCSSACTNRVFASSIQVSKVAKAAPRAVEGRPGTEAARFDWAVLPLLHRG